MPSDKLWHDLEKDAGREAFQPDSTKGSVGAIACVWLVFYLLAVAHSLLTSRTAEPISTAKAEPPSVAAAR